MNLFKNKYRTESTRLKNWDYSQEGAYFITICTQNMTCFFGDIKNGKMKLNEIGEIAHKYWQEIPNHFPNTILDEFVIMPNHVHGILIIAKKIASPNVETPNLGVSTERNTNHKPEWKPNSLGSIINQYKRICTIESRSINPNFTWQPRYYDRIIRNKNELNRIREYIINNPLKWELDRNNPNNLKKSHPRRDAQFGRLYKRS